MELKTSHYNYFAKSVDRSEFLLYNCLYRSLIILSPNEYEETLFTFDRLKENSSQALNTDLATSLKEHRFIVDKSFDELEFFKFGYFRSLYGGKTLTTILLPTLKCNFNCPYCFERKSGTTMSDKTMDKYLSWIGGKLHNKKHFHITWFGGEPLLCLQRMKETTLKAKEICNSASCSFSASVTTNGYLLKGEVIEELFELGIANVHVTLDGAAEDHDRYRFINGGFGTFDTIRSNIEEYCTKSKSHLPLHIRINVTDSNMERIPYLFKEFSSNVRERSSIYFRYVWSSSAAGNKIFSSDSESPTAFKKLSQLYHFALMAGFKVENPIDPFSFNYCEVDYADHFAIDPIGNIYLCGHLYCSEEAIGNVEQPISEEKISEYCKWINTNPFSDTECITCNILPLCRGGCRKSRFFGKRSCIEEKNGLESYVQILATKYTNNL